MPDDDDFELSEDVFASEEEKFDLGTAWYRKVAGMDREELFRTLEYEAKIRGTVTDRLNQTRQQVERVSQQGKAAVKRAREEERNRQKVFVALQPNHAQYSIERMGLNPQRTLVLGTDTSFALPKMRGIDFGTRDVLLVRGWSAGRWADEVARMLNGSGVILDGCAYAPDPHIDRLEEEGPNALRLYPDDYVSIDGSKWLVVGAARELTREDERLTVDLRRVS